MARPSHTRGAALTLILVLLASACGSPTATPSPPATQPGATPTAGPTTTEPGATSTAVPSPGETQTPPIETPTAEPTPTAPPATGGTVRVAMAGFPDDRNPGNGVLIEAYNLYDLVYDTPISLASDGSYVPELASSWSVSEDELTWTMNIVEGARFHDGQPVTAEDIAFTILLYQATEDFPYLPSYTAGFETVEATDPTTVVITTAEPIANFESRMVFMFVLPKHIWEGVGDPVEFNNADMIGSGPFRLAGWDRRVSYTLDAVKDHWRMPPLVDRVTFQSIQNEDARVLALQQDQVDMITEFPATAVNTLRNDPNVEVLIADPVTGSLEDVFFNMADPANCPEDGVCSGHPALRDIEVRRALAEATDKQAIVDVSLLGLGTPGLSLVPQSMGDFYAADVADYTFSIEAANSRLQAAGYVDTDGDGIRECKADQQCPTGDLTFRWFYPDDSVVGPRESDLIADMWQQVGVALQIQALDGDTLTSVCCPGFDYDIIRWGWGVDPDPSFLLGVALCTEIDSGFNETAYCNPTYDDLFDQQAVQTDHATRAQTIREMQRILIEDVPYIILYYYQETQAYRIDNFVGWPTNDPTLTLQSAESLSSVQPLP
jgi:peptide/nickel transport system substrate-binding protein